jgi:hypothetical protein
LFLARSFFKLGFGRKLGPRLLGLPDYRFAKCLGSGGYNRPLGSILESCFL